MKRFCSRRHYTTPPHPNPNPSPPHLPILRLCASRHLFQALHLLNSTTNPLRLPSKPLLYAALLQASTNHPSPSHGLQLHSRVIKSGLDSDRFVGNSLLSFYFKLSPDFALTRQVFDDLPAKDVISWTSIVSGYVRTGDPERSLLMFAKMVGSGVEPNAFTLSAAVKACSDLGNLRLGACFHGMFLGRGFGSNHVIASALVDMYGKTSALEDARRVFDELLQPDKICWTSMISALTRNDRFEEAVWFFYSMIRWLLPDGFTFGTVLTSLGNLGRARQGREVHAKVVTSGLAGNVVVESSVVDMYAKCGLVEDSRLVFDRMVNKNAVSRCALLGGYCQSGDHEAVLMLFREMDKDENQEHYSFGTVLRACAGLAAVRQGKEVHCRFTRTGGLRDVVVESALVDLYAKCGLIDYAFRVFSKISMRNLITWNAMISGFAQNGQGLQAVEIFDEMVREGTIPDYISFVGVLFACSHTGLVEEGKKYFKSMSEDYGITRGIEHYNCMVDLLSRVGLLEEAEDLVRESAYRDDSSLWAALLGACTTYSDPAVGERVAKRMMELEPRYHLSYILLANVYRTVGRWSDALAIRRLMKARGVRKAPGKSWIEVNSGFGSYPRCTNSFRSEFQGSEDLDSDEATVTSI